MKIFLDKIIKDEKFVIKVTWLFTFAMLFDIFTTLYGLSCGHVELNPNWLSWKYWIFVTFMFLSFSRNILFSESDIVKYIYLVFCVGFSLGWTAVGFHNIIMIIKWWNV